MYEHALKRRKQMDPGESVGLDARRKLYAQQIAVNTGVGNSARSVDPVYRLIDGFASEFDAVGQQRSAEYSAQNRDQKAEDEERSQKVISPSALRRRHDSPVYSHSSEEIRQGNFYDRFSSHAFRHGRLAASVMAGKGREMFLTCFRRAGADSRPETGWQRALESEKSVTVPVMNQPADVTFVRDASSAVGITLDAIRSAGRTLDIFRQLAGDDKAHSQNRLEQHGVTTMRELYPFLTTEADSELILQYQRDLKLLENDQSPQGRIRRQALSSALTKATAVKARKESQKQRFLTVLTRIQSNVDEAERLFSQDGFAEEILTESQKLPDVPPDDGKKRRTTENSLLGDILEELFGSIGQEMEDGEYQTEPSGPEFPSDEA